MSTAIQWTEETWNPVTGCSKVSPGCAYCYAERVSKRFGRGDFARVVVHPDRLDQPLRWRKPRRVFVDSMGDLFHEDVPTEFIDRVFGVMGLAQRHTFQVLTKRPERMRDFVRDWLSCFGPMGDPLSNVQLGVSAENQRMADLRVPVLLNTPAAVRFVSFEPLLGAIDLRPFQPFRILYGDYRAARGATRPGLDWVIAGGESAGPANRRLVERCDCLPGGGMSWGGKVYRSDCPGCGGTGWSVKYQAREWVRSLRDQCQAADTPFFFKGFGGPTPKSGGRLLDGRTWDEYPR